MATTSPRMTILFITANPPDTQMLDVGTELRELKQKLRGTRYGARFEVEHLPAAQISDILQALRDYEPAIIHFSAHGDSSGEFYLNAVDGKPQPISAEDLAETLHVYQVGLGAKQPVRLAVLAGCYTATAADLVAQHVDCAVGMNDSISDRALAKIFTPSFYAALACGCSVQNAIDSAKVELRSHKYLEEAGMVHLSTRKGVDPTEVMFSPPETSQFPPQESAATETQVEQRVQLSPPLTRQKPGQHLFSRVLLLVLAMTLFIVGILLIANRIGSLPGPSQPRVTETIATQMTGDLSAVPEFDTSTALASTTAAALDMFEGTSQPAPLDTPSGKVVIADNGATIIDPVHIELARIPADEVFLMGSDPTKDSAAREDEIGQVDPISLPEYFIGKNEVTNQQYSVFLAATAATDERKAPTDWQNGAMPMGKENHPVVYVSWYDAIAFTEWLSKETGRTIRLPTEAEWEKACRGTDHRIYPWGNAFDASKANTIESDFRATTEVGRYTLAGGDSLYEVTDMAGNVWEWTNSQYWGFGYPYVRTDGRENMSGSDSRTLRGGSFNESAASVRCAVRHGYGAEYDSGHYGFRILMTSP